MRELVTHLRKRAVALLFVVGLFVLTTSCVYTFGFGVLRRYETTRPMSKTGQVSPEKPTVLGSTSDDQSRGQVKGVVSPEEADSLVFRIKTVFSDTVSLAEALVLGALEVQGDANIDGNVTVAGDLVVQGGEIEATNVVYSIEAQDGLTITGDQRLVLQNTDLGSAQNIFKNFKIGSTTLSAESNDDTLTWEAGTGVSLTNSGKTITVAADAVALNVSGWTKNGASVVLGTATDNVGIGTTDPTSKLYVSGNTTISGNLSVLGTTTVLSGFNNSGGGILNAGAITGATGLTSSGTITFSGLSTGIMQSSLGGVVSSSPLNLASGASYLTGTLPTTNGGTGLASYNTGDILYASGANTLAALGLGGDGEVLTVSSGSLAWGTVSGGGDVCPTCLVNNPGSTQTITPTNIGATGLVVKQASSGTADVFRVESTDGSNTFFKIDSSGNVTLGSQTSSGVFTVSPVNTDPISISPVAQGAGQFTGTITSQDLTAGRTWTFPDASGIVCLATGNCSGTSASMGGSGTTNYLTKFSSTFAITDSVLYDNGTNVGLGTTVPTSKLHVVGTTYLNGATNVGGALTASTTLGVTGNTTLSGNLGVTGASNLNNTLEVSGATTLSSTLGVTGLTTLGSNLQVNGTGNSYFMGNVGVGTTAPSYKLHMTGMETGALFERSGQGSLLVTISGSGYPIKLIASNELQLFSGSSVRQQLDASGNINFNSGDVYFQNSSGNVGIGTTTPAQKLDVNGNVKVLDSAAPNIFGSVSASGLRIDGGNIELRGGSGGTVILGVNGAGGNINSRFSASGFTNNTYGTAGTPAYNFGSAGVDNGIFQPTAGTADSLGFSVGGVERVRISDFGNIGIGTTTPIGKLNVEGASTGKALAILNETGNQSIFTASASGTTRFVIQNDGNVGIGTRAPLGKLNVTGTTGITWNGNTPSFGLVNIGSGTGNGSAGGSLFINTAAYNFNAGLGFDGVHEGAVNGTSVVNVKAYGIKYAGYGSALAFSTTNGTALSEAMRIDRNGNLGIGTTSPQNKLSVDGVIDSGYTSGSGEIRSYQVAGSNYISVKTAAPKSGLFRSNTDFFVYYDTINGNTNLDATYAGSSNLFKIQGVEIMRVDNSGNVGIGTTSPIGIFNVNGDATGKALVILNETGNQNIISASASGSTVFNLDRSGNITWDQYGCSNRNCITPSARHTFYNYDIYAHNGGNIALNADGHVLLSPLGNVGIGTTSPVSKVHVKGSASGVTSIFQANATTPGNLTEWQNSSGTAITKIDANGFLDFSSSAAPNTFNTVLKINDWNVGATEISGGFDNGFIKLSDGRSFLNLITDNSVNSLFSGGISTEGYRRFAMTGSGTWNVGGGSATYDTTLERMSGGGWQVSTTGSNAALNVSGNLGVGTTAPASIVHLYSNTEDQLVFTKTNASEVSVHMGMGAGTQYSNGNFIIGATNNAAAANRIMEINPSSHYVGFGTNPNAVVHILNTAEQLRVGYDASNYTRFISRSDGKIDIATVGTDPDFEIATANFANSFFIDDSAGMIGIGTNAPTVRLDVEAGAGKDSLIRAYTSDSGYSAGYFLKSGLAGATWKILTQQTYESNALLFGTGAPYFMALDTVGNLGIGTTIPGYMLDVAGDIGFNGSIISRGDIDTKIVASTDQLEFQAGGLRFLTLSEGTNDYLTGNLNRANLDFIWNGDTNYNVFTIDASAETIGIGTDSPVSKLDVQGAVTGKALSIFNETGDQDIIVASASGATRMKVSNSGVLSLYNAENQSTSIQTVGYGIGSGWLQFNAGGTNGDIALFRDCCNSVFSVSTSFGTSRFNYDLSVGGNMGIGTSSPATKLDVSGNIGVGVYPGGEVYHNGDTDTKMDFGNNKLRLQAGGTPSIQVEAAIFSGNWANQTDMDFSWDGDTNDGVLFVDSSTENVGIGSTVPGIKLDVVGNARFSAVGSGTYSADLNLTADGTLTTSSSDIRLKENLVDLSGAEVLSKVMQLQTYTFNWKDGGSSDIGLIAQDVAKIFPEITFTNQVDGYMGINYSRLPTLLVSAMQEQQQQIDALALKIDANGAVVTATGVVLGQTTESTQSAEFANWAQYLSLSDGMWKFLTNVVFSAKAEFADSVAFMRQVVFKDAVRFEGETLGTFVVPAGATRIQVNFKKPFSEVPTVFLSGTEVFSGEYSVESVTNIGFVVKFKTSNESDRTMQWFAVLSDNAPASPVQVLDSAGASGLTPAPVATPTPTSTSTPSPAPTTETPVVSPEPQSTATVSAQVDLQTDLVSTSSAQSN
ncbi:MAG: hypothetical protein CO156_02890 [Candidatus Pacebacteria bacterium CG_4_9_14_3_um_filter_40_12]|nr:MAG: hypothetical protein COU64_03910 [Candidatus Pacebacteria bacterium CG10_big_fil_rev_8_21_14_0_10_40_26]PIZ79230.1 MAG: hypothetical protein COY01_02285 [Candidatus Pacebacteria bacterium CG_4_10_14_0_2_um_filter_40_20]PJA68885.1 MAG: hypothetical protein CO156_02890 [Candidatus Pacebacteria bacterium CG_4_9_14_3_um_filter_40_12]PJC42197.1 MAG: hypothetical protein CO041_00995 [Candidatus Pacebacteria bacterium CG_4_9_14_0_2_um_filter_40_15]